VAVIVGEGLMMAVGVWPIGSCAAIVAVALARARDGVGAGTVLGARVGDGVGAVVAARAAKVGDAAPGGVHPGRRPTSTGSADATHRPMPKAPTQSRSTIPRKMYGTMFRFIMET